MVENNRFNWPESYQKQIKRNIGIISIKEQETIRKSKIIILGLGGLGGPLAEQLVRCGCENLAICDNDRFEISNLNRQLCTRNDVGRNKIDVIKEFLLSINPNINLKTYLKINQDNIDEILFQAKIVALSLDDPLVSILVARESKRKEVPMIESYGIPFLFSWWFTEENLNYEDFYGINTNHLSFEELTRSKVIKTNFKQRVFSKLLKFPQIEEKYNREKGVLEKLLGGELPSINFAPLVRITASYLAFDIIFSGVLQIKKKVLAPNVVGFDYFNMNKIDFDLN